MEKNIQGSLLLLIAALIWGSSFIVMKSAVDFLTPAVLLFLRFSLAAILLSLIFIKKIKNLNFQQIKGGLLTGGLFVCSLLCTDMGIELYNTW